MGASLLEMKMSQGYLKLMVYHALQQGPASGYGLVKHIQEQTGWKPSFGSIYPLLQSMEHDGHVSVSEEGRSKIYTLTTTGKVAFKAQQDTRTETYKAIAEHLRCLASMGDEEAATMANLIEQAVKTGEPFSEAPELLVLRKELYRIMKEGKASQQNFKMLITKTTHDLKRI